MTDDVETLPLEPKVAFLKRPQSYPEATGRVETIETHMSWVFLTQDYAYKLKKPVRYDFLDFSTVAARRRDCEEEVRLNRRLAAGVYLGMVALTRDVAGALGLESAGTPVDWLVKMRRLPAHRMLDRAIREGSVRRAELFRVAETLARFYRAAPSVPMTPVAYRRRLETDIRDNQRELTSPAFRLPESVVRRVSAAQLELMERTPGLLDQRVVEGRIIEAHGDLRPEHICLGPEPAIIDCLEFKREFRLLDPADELAFLAMECEHLGAPEVGELFFAAYRRITGDQPSEELVYLYKSYRACLRAKIAIWHTREQTGRRAVHWSRVAQAYLHRADAYAAELA
jgi:aminoglycoside phosphotransferase family enzyme